MEVLRLAFLSSGVLVFHPLSIALVAVYFGFSYPASFSPLVITVPGVTSPPVPLSL